MVKQSWGFVAAAMLVSMPQAWAAVSLPPTVKVDVGETEPFCNSGAPSAWRDAQTVEGVEIQESRVCDPDNPSEIAAFVKGTNNVSMETLMDTKLAPDAVTMSNDTDGDGDPDLIVIKLEVMELNGRSPDFPGVVPTFDIAPGIQPGFWVFTPKSRDMSTRGFASLDANALLRLPSPAIRVEQGDTVWLVLENTHYFPHSIHLHGVDHPFMDHGGGGNDGVGQTAEMDVMPGQTKTYVIKPRQPGTMYYHCHVQPHTHIPMGLGGMFIVEENRPNNWVQTFNVGNGQVRHPSKAVSEKYAQEYDLHYQSADKELHQIIQQYNDPRLIAQQMNQKYDITDAKDDYYMLNGRAFPYALRESLITVAPNQKVKLRVLNGHTETMALHIHGHKAVITDYDGVPHNPAARIQRDVYDLAPAQRLDLELNTTNDGLNSFGSGVWMFHDHVENAFTTDGQGEGGSISLVVYKDFLDKEGTPQLHGMDITPYFSKKFWKREIPVWQHLSVGESLGQAKLEGAKAQAAPASKSTPAAAKPAGKAKPAAEAADNSSPSTFGNLLKGLLLGAVGYAAYLNRRKLAAAAAQLMAQAKGGK
ncbi:multicopper oxidase domain-containing protein [Methylogaea oryzae]|nr:multicopper oxidase domain-containing protein [Methylogaea oryzae]